MATEEKKMDETSAAENTVEVVKAEVEVVDENNIVHLSKSLRGKDELIFDFAKIKGSTLLKCEKKAKEVDNSIVVPQLSMAFQAHVAAAAAGVKYDEIINLPGSDFMAVTLKVSRCGEISRLKLSALRLAKYSKSPVGYFLELPIGDFYEWVKVMNEEMEREIAAHKRAAKKHG